MAKAKGRVTFDEGSREAKKKTKNCCLVQLARFF
jgi:hypothetical protein